MKTNKILSLFAAGACAFAVTISYAGHEPPAEPGNGPHILIMASPGTVGSGTHTYAERLGGLAATLRELGYQVTVSDAWANIDTFSEQQLTELESYDLLWFPRRTSSSHWPREWQQVNVPILLSSPFVSHNSKWDWAYTRTGATEGTTSWMDVMQPHPILDGLEVDMDYPNEVPNSAGDALFPPNVSEHGRIVYRTDEITAYAMASAGNYINGRGTGILRHGMTEGDATEGSTSSTLWHLYVWEPGQLRGNERRRVYFNINFEELLSSVESDSHNDGMDELSDNGKELIRNVVEWVIADVPVSEHLNENFDRYSHDQSVIDPVLYDTGRIRDDGNGFQWENVGEAWAVNAKALDGDPDGGRLLDARNDGLTSTNLARRLVGGPETSGPHPYVAFDFKLRLEDMSALSGSKIAHLVLGSSGGMELTQANTSQNHVVGLQIEDGKISHLTPSGPQLAADNVGTTEWFEVSFLLNLADETYDLTISQLDDEGASTPVLTEEGQAFLSTVSSIDYVAVVADADQGFALSLDDLSVTSSATRPGAGGFAAWVAANFDPADAENPAIGGADADPDGDGIANLLEYVLGLNPGLAGRSGLPQTGIQAVEVDGSTNDYLTLTVIRRGDVADYVISVDSSADLGLWEAGSGVLVSSDDNGDGSLTEVYRSAQPVNAGAAGFLRASVNAVD